MDAPQSTPASVPPASASSAAIAPFDQYDFGADPVFQVGLESILAGVATDSEKTTATAKAKRFYYARITGQSSLPQSSVPPTNTNLAQQQADDSEAAPRYPASFAEIVQLVAEGKPIPGVRDIPNSVADAPPSQPVLKPRPKPWEMEATNPAAPSTTSV